VLGRLTFDREARLDFPNEILETLKTFKNAVVAITAEDGNRGFVRALDRSHNARYFNSRLINK
jgi:hypothetical protein